MMRAAFKLISILPFALFVLAWEAISVLRPGAKFFFSSPSEVVLDLIVAITRDGILHDCIYTIVPALIGLILAIIVGILLGFFMIAMPRFAAPFSGYISALGSFPIFAIAPMTIIWFGLGLSGKVFLAFVSSVFVFLSACYQGGMSAPQHLVRHYEDHDFTAGQIVRKLRFPYAIDWMVAAFKSSANLALLGVFVGEFVAAEHGLGRVMLNASGLYDVKRVLSSAILFAALAVSVAHLGNLALSHRRSIIQILGSVGNGRSLKA